MKKAVWIAATLVALVALSGCANRPCLKGDPSKVTGHSNLHCDMKDK